MRIGLVCPYSLTVPGGVQGQVLGLARELRRQGHEARVLGPCDGPPPEAFVTPLGNSLPTAANGSIAPLAPDASAALRTIRALNDERFDVAPRPRAVRAGAADDVGADAPGADRRHVPRRRARSPSYRILTGALRWHAGRHRPQGGGVQGRPGARRALPRRGSTTSCSTASRSTASPATPPTPTASPTIFFCGRHEERKGLAVLLEAFRSLPATTRLWIASDGPDGPRLRAEHGEDKRITWLGRISDAEKFARLRGATVFCAPSLHGESFGVVLIEAMAAGTPVVASGIDGYRNVATDGVDALLAEPGDVDALATAIGAVLDDRLLTESLRAAGHRRAEAVLDDDAGRRVHRASTVSCSTSTSRPRPSEPLARHGAHPRSLRRPPAGGRPIRLTAQVPLVHSTP